MIMEEVNEMILALFLADFVTVVFSEFPSVIIGAMLFFACLELGKSVLIVKRRLEIVLLLIIEVSSFLVNLAFGFFLGLAICYVTKKK